MPSKSKSKPTPKRKATKAAKAATSPAATDAIRAALDQLICSVLPKPTRLDLGKAASFYSIKKDSVTVCGVKIRKGVVGLQLGSIGRVYSDPEGRLVGKGTAGHMLWLRGLDDVASARPFVEQALEQAKRA